MTVQELRWQLRKFDDDIEVQVVDPKTGKFSNDIEVEEVGNKIRLKGIGQ
jgi:hypothetical protein